jgi:hypothetical protein
VTRLEAVAFLADGLRIRTVDDPSAAVDLALATDGVVVVEDIGAGIELPYADA